VTQNKSVGWTDDCSRSLKRSRILKFEKLPDPDSKTLEQERSWSLKKVTPATSATDPPGMTRLEYSAKFISQIAATS